MSGFFRCPRCHKGKLYKSLLSITDRCSECGLPLAQHEQGDGPAFFVILIVGAFAAIGATVVEIKYQPSFWLHAALWIPFVIIGTLVGLRVFKAMIIAAQYKLRGDDFS